MKSSEDFETYVQFVYDKILNLTGEGIQVAHRARLKGKSQSWYEIDVCYEFMRAEVVHRVAFECKYWNKNVDRDQTLAFQSKLGFQRDSREYASHYGIDLPTLSDLPGFSQAVSRQLTAAALYNPTKRGEPFWVIMEQATASYWAPEAKTDTKSIPLFISKRDAQRFLELIPDKGDLVVCGLPLVHLNFLGEAARMSRKIQLGIVPLIPEGETAFAGFPQTPEEIHERFIQPLRQGSEHNRE